MAKAQAPSLSKTLGIPTNWNDYWTFALGASALLFVAYLVVTGQAQVWLALFTWSQPESVAPPVGTSATPSAAPAVNTSPNAASQAPITVSDKSPAPGAIGTFETFLTQFGV